MDAERKPLARSESLIVEELGDEVLVYDLDGDNVHCLTSTAARVWRACDGSKDTPGLVAELDLSGDEISHALSELNRCGLIEAPPTLSPPSNGNGGHSRRDFGLRVAKVAVATASAPLILTIAAPAAAQSQSEIDICLNIPTSNGCGLCNAGGTAGGPCCCCNPKNGNDKVCAASQPHCELIGGAGSKCTEDDKTPTPTTTSSVQSPELSPPSSSAPGTSTPPPASESVVPPPAEPVVPPPAEPVPPPPAEPVVPPPAEPVPPPPAAPGVAPPG